MSRRDTIRLVSRPAFILSLMRSGSTLLRCILDSHSEIHAPHELHLGSITVETAKAGRSAMNAMALRDVDLKYMVWDRILYGRLVASGKRRIVEKTPWNIGIYQDLANCWPNARFIFLKRDPRRILDSLICSYIFESRRECIEYLVEWATRRSITARSARAWGSQ